MRLSVIQELIDSDSPVYHSHIYRFIKPASVHGTELCILHCIPYTSSLASHCC